MHASKAAAHEGEGQAGAGACAREGGRVPYRTRHYSPCAPDHDFKLGRHSYTSSHSRALKSPLPDATIRPSGLKHTVNTEEPRWCC